MKGILSAIINEIKKSNPEHPILTNYRILVKDLRNVSNESEKDHKTVSGHIPNWEDVIIARDKAFNDGNLIDFVILSLYTYVPPRRLGDYGNMYACSDIKNAKDTQKNYYISGDKLFIFNAYKTSKTFKRQQINVPDELSEILDFYAEKCDLHNGDKLLPITAAQLGKRLTHLVGCSVNNLRHSFINNRYKRYNIPDSADIEEEALSMAHSTQQHLRYRKDV